MSNFKLNLRKKLLDWLRPGKTEEELLNLVQRAEFIQSDEQRRMLIQAVEFHDTRVREIMTPRSEIHAIDISISPEELEQEMMKATSTRLPVIDGNMDNVIGVVHLWDLFSVKIRGGEIKLAELIRPCTKISELQRIEGLLSEMREASHIAVVQDEFGGTAGLVTLSDLLEEIVGSIDEDNNDEEAGIIRLDDGSLEVVARVHIEELEEALDMEFPEGDFDTVAGLITHELGRIPMAGEKIKVASLAVTILEADPRRIVRVRISPVSEG